jgi:uncharacterized membrane protein YtjA (UPF0391 family)
MLRWSGIFFVVAVLSGIPAFTGSIAQVASFAQLVFFVCVGLFVACLLLGVTSNKALDYGGD